MLTSYRLHRKPLRRRAQDPAPDEMAGRFEIGTTDTAVRADETADWIQAARRTLQAKKAVHQSAPPLRQMISAFCPKAVPPVFSH